MMTAGRRSAVIPTQWSVQNLCLNAGLKAKRVLNETRPESKEKIKNPLQTCGKTVLLSTISKSPFTSLDRSSSQIILTSKPKRNEPLVSNWAVTCHCIHWALNNLRVGWGFKTRMLEINSLFFFPWHTFSVMHLLPQTGYVASAAVMLYSDYWDGSRHKKMVHALYVVMKGIDMVNTQAGCGFLMMVMVWGAQSVLRKYTITSST